MKKALLILLVLGNSTITTSAQSWREWATYYGGSAQDIGLNVTTDLSGNVYLSGQTFSTSGIATAGAHQNTFGGGSDAFLVKFNSAGVRLWATYYGGSGSDYGMSVKTDAAGNVYMAGYTSSVDSIATAGSFQPAISAGAPDAYVVKFNSSGVRQWATYYGGPDYEQGQAIAVDVAGNVFLTGWTNGTTGFATAGAHQLTNGGEEDGFLVKFNSTGSTQLWGTYYGGYVKDYAIDAATDAAGNVVICGHTGSPDSIASAGSHQPAFGGDNDAFVAKFSPSGNRLWATYYGGAGAELVGGIATGPGNVIYLMGQTGSSTAIATAGAFDTSYGGDRDAFLVKFDSTGTRLWGTYYGGTANEEGEDVAVNAAGYVFIAGDVYSTNGGNPIATLNGFQTNLSGTENFFLAGFTPGGIRLNASYFGNFHEEEGHVAVSSSGAAYISGYTPSTSGITYQGFQNSFAGGIDDALLIKFTTWVPDTGVVVPNDTFPPTPTVYIPPIKWYTISLYDWGGTTISNASFKSFSPGQPLPASGSEIISFTCTFSGSYSNSSGTVPVACPATLQVRLDFLSAEGTTRYYNTEMLQLDLLGGTLPSGVWLRESPTLVSTGLIAITDIGGGLYRISSFFDVFTELSTDNGNSWHPSTDQPAHIALQNDVTTNSIPTLSEWGLIVMAVLMFCTGIFYIRRLA